MTINYSRRKIYKTVILGFLLVNLYSCNRDNNNPGWDYFPDMFYSTAYETYSKNPNFEDGMTMRGPVRGTVPRGFTPFEYTNAPESRIKAGKELLNPITSTPEALLRGKLVLHRMSWQFRRRRRPSFHKWSVPLKTAYSFRKFSN
jgi:hypothetical protein